MAETTVIKPFLCEGMDKSVLRIEWEKWLRSLNIYLSVENITDKVKKRNHLLHLGGIQLQDVAYSLPDAIIEKDETNDVFEILTKKIIRPFFSKTKLNF